MHVYLNRPRPKPPRPDPLPALPRRSFRFWLAGVHRLHCGCIVTQSETCPHGWMIRVLG